VLDCPGCRGRLRLLALIEQARVVERILRHLGRPTDRPLHVDDLAFHMEAPADATC
jgi:hypothetical protein